MPLTRLSTAWTLSPHLSIKEEASYSRVAYPARAIAQRFGGATSRISEEIDMAKGQQAPKTNNKPKLSVKEKKQKKKEKAAAKAARG